MVEIQRIEQCGDRVRPYDLESSGVIDVNVFAGGDRQEHPVWTSRSTLYGEPLC